MKHKIHPRVVVDRLRFVSIVFCIFFLIPLAAQGASFNSTMPTVLAPGYKIQILVPGSHFHGIHGLAFDSEDNLYAGSVAGQAIYRVNTDTGETNVFVGPPEGVADDLDFGPDGKLYWTGFFQGCLFAKSADGKILTLADGLPGLNSLAFNQEGRLFATQVFMGDALYEIDLSGQKKNRKIADKLGGLNGFDFGPDGYLYGPLWFKGEVVKVDVDSGKVETVADGFKIPAAVNFDSKGNLYVLDTATGEVVQVDVKTGEKTVIAQMAPHLDNLAIDSKDRIYVTNMAVNGIYEVDKKTGKSRTVVEGKLALPQGIAVSTNSDGDTLYVADNWTCKKVDGFTGQVTEAKAHVPFPNTTSVHGDRILFCSWFTGGVHELDRKTGQEIRSLQGFKAPTHALMMDDGSLIVAEGGSGSLIKVTDQVGKQRSVVAEGLVLPTYMAPAGPTAVYVTEYGAGTVSKVDLKTGDKKVVVSGLAGPEGIAVKSDGNLLVVDTPTQQLLQIDPASGAITPMVVNLAVGLSGFKGGLPPYMITGVAVSDTGTIYVTGDLENVIYKISPRQ